MNVVLVVALSLVHCSEIGLPQIKFGPKLYPVGQLSWFMSFSPLWIRKIFYSSEPARLGTKWRLQEKSGFIH